MTAYPQKVEVERMFRNPGSTQAAASARPWRVVSADGSSVECHFGNAGSPTGATAERATPAKPQAADFAGLGRSARDSMDRLQRRRAGRRTADGVQRQIGVNAAGHRSIGLPATDTELSALLKDDPKLLLGQLGDPGAAAPIGEKDAKAVANSVARPAGKAPVGPGEAPVSAGPSAGCRPPKIDLQLARLVEAWPRLPRSVQAALLAMVDATTPDARPSKRAGADTAPLLRN